MITVVERCTKNGWYWYVLNQSGEILVAKASALNGIAYRDDSQVVELHAYRLDDKERPRVEVQVIRAAVYREWALRRRDEP